MNRPQRSPCRGISPRRPRADTQLHPTGLWVRPVPLDRADDGTRTRSSWLGGPAPFHLGLIRRARSSPLTQERPNQSAPGFPGWAEAVQLQLHGLLVTTGPQVSHPATVSEPPPDVSPSWCRVYST